MSTSPASPPSAALMPAPVTLPDPAASVALERDPDLVVRDAERAIATLGRVLARVPPLVIAGRRYLHAADWALIAAFFSVRPHVVETRPLRGPDGRVMGYEAMAEAVHTWTGRVCGRAEAECTREEPRWRDRPRSQLRAMAQTRAGRRVLAQTFSWVASLGGFADLAAEDLDERDARERPISEEQRRTLWKVAREAGWRDDQVATYLATTIGSADTRSIRRDEFPDVLATLERGPGPVDPPPTTTGGDPAADAGGGAGDDGAR